SPVPGYDPAHEGEAETAARGRNLRPFPADERLEDPLDILWRDPGALVANHDHHGAAVVRSREVDRRARRAVCDRILGEVFDCRRQELLVAADEDFIRRLHPEPSTAVRTRRGDLSEE